MKLVPQPSVFPQASVFQARTLVPRMASRAFPLVQLSNPSIDLRTWMDYVRACGKGPRGIGGLTAIEDERAYIYGLFSWSLVHHLTCRKSLRISDVIMVQLSGRALQEAVFAEFQNLADTTGAGSIVLLAGDHVGGLRREAALGSGFRPAGELFEMICSKGRTQTAPPR